MKNLHENNKALPRSNSDTFTRSSIVTVSALNFRPLREKETPITSVTTSPSRGSVFRKSPWIGQRYQRVYHARKPREQRWLRSSPVALWHIERVTFRGAKGVVVTRDTARWRIEDGGSQLSRPRRAFYTLLCAADHSHKGGFPLPRTWVLHRREDNRLHRAGSISFLFFLPFRISCRNGTGCVESCAKRICRNSP